MELSINSRKLDKIVTFSQPGSSYIYIDLNGETGTLGNQICDGGSLGGSTIGCRTDDCAAFERICRKWWKAFLLDDVNFWA